MIEKQASVRQLTDQEIAMELDLHSGEGSVGIENLDNFYAAQKALFTAISTCMRGVHQSDAEASGLIEELVETTAKNFATVYAGEDDLDRKIDDLSIGLHRSLIDLKFFIDSFEVPVQVEVSDLEDLKDAYREVLDEDDYDVNYDISEQSFGSLYSYYLSDLLEHCQDSEVEMRQEKRHIQKRQALAIGREIAKASLNAAALAAAIRIFSKKS